VLAVVLTTSASASLSASAERKGLSVARALTLRMEEWVAGHHRSLSLLASTALDDMASAETARELVRIDQSTDEYSLLRITDLTGRTLSTSRPAVTVATTARTGSTPPRPGGRR
jgi:hypothetical protein